MVECEVCLQNTFKCYNCIIVEPKDRDNLVLILALALGIGIPLLIIIIIFIICCCYSRCPWYKCCKKGQLFNDSSLVNMTGNDWVVPRSLTCLAQGMTASIMM